MQLGRDVSSFFPDVVKLVIVETTEIKKLVFMFLERYAEQEEECALLSINTLRKDLSSSNQRTRANALKAITGIKVPMVLHLIVLSVRTAVKDSSAFVRRVAAQAIPKIFQYVRSFCFAVVVIFNVNEFVQFAAQSGTRTKTYSC